MKTITKALLAPNKLFLSLTSMADTTWWRINYHSNNDRLAVPWSFQPSFRETSNHRQSSHTTSWVYTKKRRSVPAPLKPEDLLTKSQGELETTGTSTCKVQGLCDSLHGPKKTIKTLISTQEATKIRCKWQIWTTSAYRRKLSKVVAPS